jgi:hypothetical protein
MPTFRCFGLTKDNRILWGRHIEANGVTDALVACQQVLPEVTHAFEIWLRAHKVFPWDTPYTTAERKRKVRDLYLIDFADADKHG